MKPTSASKIKILNVWSLTLGLAIAVMASPHAAVASQGGTSLTHLISETQMTSAGVDANASGKINVILTGKGNVNNLLVKLSLAKLDPNTAYQLVGFLGADTNGVSVAEFTTDKQGDFQVSYVENGKGKLNSHQEPLPDAMNPMCNVRELDVVNGGGATVLRGMLADPDQGQYLVKRSLNNSGFFPAAVGEFQIKANAKFTRFSLKASHLNSNTDYDLAINGNVVQAFTSDHAGKLNLKELPPGSPSALDIQTLALTDATGINVILIAGGMGIPCTLASQAPPTVSSTVPANTATGVAINANIAASFSEVMNAATINTNSFTLMQGNTPVAGTVTYAGVTAVFNPLTDLIANTLYTAAITTGSRDLADNALAANYSWTFSTGATGDTTVPTVSAIAPGDAATNVAVNLSINAVFSEAMNPSTINSNSFTLKQGATVVNGKVSYANGTATFAPATNLTANAVYTATLTTGATDLSGNALAANVNWSFTTSASTDTNRPSIFATNPTNRAVNVAVNQTINATFSEAMNPLTISTTTFKVTGPGKTNVAGTVAYLATGMIATFTPATNLAPGTTYTNTITTGAKDLAGNAVATNFVWVFTTGTQTATNPQSINLGAASTFAILATAAINGGGDQINGDVGLHPGSAQGIDPSQINGTIHVNDQAVIDAQASLLAAYNEAVNRSVNAQTLEGNLGGLTKAPGLYVNGSSTGISGTGPNAILTLDAQGDANAVFIFKMASTLTTDPGTSIVLSGGAQAKNVYWQVGSSATLNTTTIFKGNILAAVSITVNSGCMVDGRLFAGAGGDASGAVTIQSSTITVPAP